MRQIPHLLPRALIAYALAIALTSFRAQAEEQSPPDLPGFLRTYCIDCHAGEDAEAGLDLSRFYSAEKITQNVKTWNEIVNRIASGEMPPEGAEAPPSELRDQLVTWLSETIHCQVCGDGIAPAPAPLRRLNRGQYAATVRDLLGTHFNAAHALPEDGAGGEGFDNAAETLFLSPVHAEKYLEAAREALDYAMKDTATRERIIIATPADEHNETSVEQAAQQVLARFLPRAFRRPVVDDEVETYLELFRTARAQEDSYQDSLLFALQGALLSPHFLFRVEPQHMADAPALVDDYALASRLSYFLWNSMPDEDLMRLASEGKLNDSAVLREQTQRMLQDKKASEFAQSFIEQWLGTREYGRAFKPETTGYRRWNDELVSAIKYEPVAFFQHLLAEDLSLLSLIDSDFSFLNDKLLQHYRLKIDGVEQPLRRTELPADSHRGGVLGMAAVLGVSSYSHRTSPVLRGKWVLETMLGTPPPPPPPNVPELPEADNEQTPQSLRERLALHRANPSCATCHDRIDPIGFGLENFDHLGRWRDKDGETPIDSSGKLPDGVEFHGPEELKKVLLSRKDQFTKHLTTKLLGYALGRGLVNEDYCAVDEIAVQVAANEYSAQTMVSEIVLSTPFRYQPGTDRTLSVPTPATQ